MMTNSSFEAIRSLKYGYSVLANAKSFKTRLKRVNAEEFISNIHANNRHHLCVYNTTKGYTFIAVVAHHGESIWNDLAYAHALIMNNKLRAKAAKKLAIAERKTDEANAILAWIRPVDPQPMRTQQAWIDELPF